MSFCPYFIRFQFHKGTIRTVKFDNGMLPQTYFNSIKVRLEPYQRICVCCWNLFQFHKGTIRTYYNAIYCCLNCNFNSIKVRLELIISLVFCPVLNNFNSIKVRLELYDYCTTSLVNSFQFHKGTIRTSGQKSNPLVKVISIP